MSKYKSRLKWLLITAACLVVLNKQAQATTPQSLDIHVSIAASKSLTVDSTSYNFGPLAVNVSSVSAMAIVVGNNSGGLTETYTITGDDATSDTGGTDWTLDTSTGTDRFALAAQFGDARPNDDTGSWDSDDLTTGTIICTDDALGNGVSGETGLNVLPTVGVNERNLWFRIRTPDVVSDGGSHTITITLAVQ